MNVLTLAEVLAICAPPLSLIDRLEADQTALNPDEIAYLKRWQAIRAGEPVPELDRPQEEAPNDHSWHGSPGYRGAETP
jgi:hypothetical protein